MPTYDVRTERFGTIPLVADSIRQARKWAATAFPHEPHSVTLQQHYRWCEVCESKPCVCEEKRPMPTKAPRITDPEHLALLAAYHGKHTDPHEWAEARSRLLADGIEPGDWTAKGRRRKTELTRPLRLLIETRGNPDHDEDPTRPVSPVLDVACKNLSDAVQYAAGYRDYYDLGGGNWYRAVVRHVETGVEVARISYNGRAWKPGTTGESHTDEIDVATSNEDLRALRSCGCSG